MPRGDIRASLGLPQVRSAAISDSNSDSDSTLKRMPGFIEYCTESRIAMAMLRWLGPLSDWDVAGAE